MASHKYNQALLTHWSRVTHIYVSKLTIVGSDNDLSPGRRQAIIWTNVRILLIWPLGINFSEIFIEIHISSFKKMHLKMSSANAGHMVLASMCYPKDSIICQPLWGIAMLKCKNAVTPLLMHWIYQSAALSLASPRILCMHPANVRRRYNVTSSHIGWEHTQNDPCITIGCSLWCHCTL